MSSQGRVTCCVGMTCIVKSRVSCNWSVKSSSNFKLMSKIYFLKCKVELWKHAFKLLILAFFLHLSMPLYEEVDPHSTHKVLECVGEQQVCYAVWGRQSLLAARISVSRQHITVLVGSLNISVRRQQFILFEGSKIHQQGWCISVQKQAAKKRLGCA